MCGACGAGSARSPTQHWSAPFLASVPARAAAARTLTRWSRTAGWPGTVVAVAGGFEIATATGRRSLASNLEAAVQQLIRHGVSGTRLLASSTAGVVEGPPTEPGERLRGNALSAATAVPLAAAAALTRPAGSRWTMPPDLRRRYRVPGLLAWVCVAEKTTRLARTTVHLALGGSHGMLLSICGVAGVSCDAAPAPTRDLVLGAEEAICIDLVALLCSVDATLLGRDFRPRTSQPATVDVPRRPQRC